MTSDRIVDLPAGRSTEPSVHHATALADAAYTTIKERIRTCQLAPGQRITEKGLVEDTGYGKTPVREGLGRLVNEQLVDVMPRSGYRVRSLTLQDVDEVFEAWRIAWPEVVVLASRRITPADMDVLRAMAFDERGAVRDDYAMFRFVLAMARNRRLAAMLDRVLDEIERLAHLLARQGVATQLPQADARIRKSFVTHDEAALRESVLRWIDAYYSSALQALRQLPAVRGAALI